MRAVLNTSVRPRIGQSRLASGRGPSTTTRRTTFPPLQRRLTVCDAFTILLAPIFTAAFVVDVSQRARRAQEWDRQIAQIQQETEHLRETQLRSWSRLQLRSVCTGVRHQRRNYSTAGTSTGTQQNKNATEPNRDNLDVRERSLSELHQYENLLATKVGLQLLLYISTGRDPTAKLNIEGLPNAIVVLDDMDALMEQLKRVNKGLYELEKRLPARATDFTFETRGSKLDQEVSKLTWQCRTGALSIPNLIHGYTRAVVMSQTGLSLHTYQNLVETLSTLDADVLTSIAMFPYLKTRQVLSDRIITSIIYQYGKLKDPRRLDKFLWQLTQPGRDFRIANDWEFVVVDGVRVPAPVNRHPKILDILIRTALQGDQPHKARAWAILLVRQHDSTNHMATLFNNFLTYCARHVNWAYGQLWLHRTITWASLFAKSSPKMLQTLVFRMLDLCISCGQSRQYEKILDAAVFARLDVPPIDSTRPDALADQSRKIHRDWAARLKQRGAHPRGLDEVVEAARIFQSEMAKINSAIANFVGVANITELKILMAEAALHDRFPMSEGETMISSVPSRIEPWNETNHLGSPDELLDWKAKDRVWFDPQTWFLGNSSKNGSPMPENNVFGEAEDLRKGVEPEVSTKQNAILQSGNGYQRNTDIIHDGNYTAQPGSVAEQNLLDYQRQKDELLQQNILLQKQTEAVKADNSYLLAKLEASHEKELELVRSMDELKSQIGSTGRKSLETVFLEKENFNIRFDMRELTARYEVVMIEKHNLQNEIHKLRAHSDGLENRTAKDVDLLHKENRRLQEQLTNAEMQYEKRIQASKAREGNLQKIILMKEERLNSLRDELSTIQSNSKLDSRSDNSATAPDNEVREQDSSAADQKRSFVLRSWRRGGNNHTDRHGSDNTLTYSSS